MADTVRNYIKPKSRLRRIMSKVLNFLCALLIMFVVIVAIGAFIQADSQTKSMERNYDSPIFSYAKVDDSRAQVKAFGDTFTIDLDKVSELKDRMNEIAGVNRDYTPSFIILSGDIISECLTSVGKSLAKIPDIVRYFYDKTASADNTSNTNNTDNTINTDNTTG